jgi:Fe2+ transport system protein FeoA
MSATTELPIPTRVPALVPPVAGEFPLAELRGRQARVVSVSADAEDATRLMALGLCVGRRVEVVKAGDPMIVRVIGAQVGLSARLAAHVLVAVDSQQSSATSAA